MKTLLLALTIWSIGCTSSTQVKRDETTTIKTIDTTVMVAFDRAGQSQNYSEWRRWILPVLEFEPDSVQPVATFTTTEGGDTSRIDVNLRTGRATLSVRARVRVEEKQETTHKIENVKEESKSWLAEFLPLLIWIAIILAVLVVGYLVIKPKFL